MDQKNQKLLFARKKNSHILKDNFTGEQIPIFVNATILVIHAPQSQEEMEMGTGRA